MHEKGLYARGGGGGGGTPLFGEKNKVFRIFSHKRGIQLASWVLNEVIRFDHESMTYGVSCVKGKNYLSIKNSV